MDIFLSQEENAGSKQEDKKLVEAQDDNEKYFLLSSKPYCRKNNVTSDKSMVSCWEMHLRFNDFDLYVTLLKRSYIPPMMDLYQDIFVVSQYFFKFSSNQQDG